MADAGDAALMPHRELLRQVVQTMRDDAIGYVCEYARRRCPSVPHETVEAIANALGDISVDEAVAVLDRIERTGA